MDLVKKAAMMIGDAKRILVLTGAGVSTASNIPDFRSKEGLYSKAPEQIVSHDYFFKRPDRFYEFVFKNMYHPEAKPNLGHKIITKWEKEGRIIQVVTQNIDGLHQMAGTKNVIEFHGTIHQNVCLQCKCSYTMQEMIERKEAYFQAMKSISEKNLFYICDECEGELNKRYIKPNIVLYGEKGYWLTGNPFYQIQCLSYDADLILVLGSTMKVFPFQSIPNTRNQDKNTQMIIINQGETPYDDKSWVHVIKKDISKTLQEIDEEMKKV